MERPKMKRQTKEAKPAKVCPKRGRRGKASYQLPNPLVYRLSDPGYTIYHRAALGGLAATVRAWQDKDNDYDAPEGITPKLTEDTVELSWREELLAVEVVKRILDASFKLTSEKLIDLPGHNISDDRRGLRLAIHNGLVGTFLQHNKMRPGEKQPRSIKIATVDDDGGDMFTYKAIDIYAHQKAQGTGLLDGDLSKRYDGTLAAKIPQSVVPGATGGMVDLEATPEGSLLLMFLMVGCSVFMLRPRTYKEKAQSCLIVPDVLDLVAFARALRNIAATGQGFKRFSNSYLGRVVGGAEEAALRFLIDLKAGDVTLEGGVAGCIVMAMGKVSWDKQQTNRSVIARLKNHYAEIDVFRAADEHLGKSKVMKTKKGESFVVLETHIPELVAANLAGERHWCAHFKELVEKKKDFENMSFYTLGGLNRMKEAVKDVTDQTLIHAFQEAWRLKRGALRARELRERIPDYRLIEVEREKMRNAILRTKTADALAGWLMQFCADATREYQSAALAKDLTQLREFIFNPRNFERFQNLCLFALVSYTRDETAKKQQTATTGGKG
jgi:CRISPR-associated protein Cas8a1/Csx13